MNTTTYDADKKIAGMQPGSQWKAVYEAIEPHGVAASGARASVVGVGGFTTGGGVSKSKSNNLFMEGGLLTSVILVHVPYQCSWVLL